MDCRWTAGLLIWFVLVATVVAAADISPEVIDQTMESAVFLKATRVFKNETFPTSGSGFFIHQDGYILTNWHVIADQIEVDMWGREREANAKVLKLTAVVNSGTPEEREIPVKVVARDRKRDLALLRVHYRPEAWIDFSDVQDVRVGDRIWTVGFPLGDFLAMERSAGPGDRANPEASISAGMVTSLRRDDKGRLAMVQTDAAVNPGNSGGPMLSAEGKLVGVVFAKVQGATGIGFGVSPDRIRAFLGRQAVKISFNPGTVLSPPQPIEVSVKPVLVELEAQSGEVIFDGDDIRPVREALIRTDTGFGATINFPERIAGAVRPERYRVTVNLKVPGTAKPISRRFRLDAIPESFETLKSARDPGEMMEDRKVFSHEMRIADYADQGAGEKKSLSDVAGNMKLQRNEKGALVVDNYAVKDVTSVPTNPKWYSRIAKEDLSSLAKELDIGCVKLEELEKARVSMVQSRANTDSAYFDQLIIRMNELRKTVVSSSSRLHVAGYCRCSDSHWYKRSNAPCGRSDCITSCEMWN